MKKRSPLAVLILSIVTFGIYNLYWLINTKRALNKQQLRNRVPSLWLLFLPVFVILAVVVLMSVILVTGAGQTTLTASGTVNRPLAGITLLLQLLAILAAFAIIPLSFYWFWKYAKAVDEYTHGKLSAPVAFLALWLIHPIGAAIVQDAFNDVADRAPTGAPMAPQPAPGVAYAQPVDALHAGYQQPAQPMQPMPPIAPSAPQSYWQSSPQPSAQPPVVPMPDISWPQSQTPPAPNQNWQSPQPTPPVAPQAPVPDVPTSDQFGNISTPSTPTDPNQPGPFQQ